MGNDEKSLVSCDLFKLGFVSIIIFQIAVRISLVALFSDSVRVWLVKFSVK